MQWKDGSQVWDEAGCDKYVLTIRTRLSTGLAGAIEISECLDKDDLLAIGQLGVQDTWGCIRLLEELYASGPTHWGEIDVAHRFQFLAILCTSVAIEVRSLKLPVRDQPHWLV